MPGLNINTCFRDFDEYTVAETFNPVKQVRINLLNDLSVIFPYVHTYVHH